MLQSPLKSSHKVLMQLFMLAGISQVSRAHHHGVLPLIKNAVGQGIRSPASQPFECSDGMHKCDIG